MFSEADNFVALWSNCCSVLSISCRLCVWGLVPLCVQMPCVNLYTLFDENSHQSVCLEEARCTSLCSRKLNYNVSDCQICRFAAIPGSRISKLCERQWDLVEASFLFLYMVLIALKILKSLLPSPHGPASGSGQDQPSGACCQVRVIDLTLSLPITPWVRCWPLRIFVLGKQCCP